MDTIMRVGKHGRNGPEATDEGKNVFGLHDGSLQLCLEVCGLCSEVCALRFVLLRFVIVDGLERGLDVFVEGWVGG